MSQTPPNESKFDFVGANGLCQPLEKLFGELRQNNMLRSIPVRSVSPSKDWASNDYLGLSTDVRLVEKGLERAREFGSGWGSSRLLGSRFQFEDRFFELIGKRVPFVFDGWDLTYFISGSQANLSFFDALRFILERTSLSLEIFIEHRAHSSLIGGARASGLSSRLTYFPSGNWSQLRQKLSRSKREKQLVVIESLHSMEGSFCDSDELVRALRSANDALLYVDEAHSFGLFQSLCWLAEAANLEKLSPYFLGAMLGCGKAVGVQGGLLLLPQHFARMLPQSSRSLVYSTGPSPFLVGAVEASLDVLASEEGDTLRADLQKRISEAQFELAELVSGATDWSLIAVPGSPILSLRHPDSQVVARFKECLWEHGFGVAWVRPPTVPKDVHMVRLTVTLSNQLELLMSALKRLI